VGLGFFRSFNPILFQSRNARGAIRERWYFKHAFRRPNLHGYVDNKVAALSIMPAVMGIGGRLRAFVQVADGLRGESHLFGFPLGALSYRDSPFELRIADNRFSLDGMDLALEDEAMSVQASIRYGRLSPLRSSPLRPGLMGPFAFIPTLTNHHEIGSMDHEVSGWAELNYANSVPLVGRFSLDGGRGYIEKNWGSAIPMPRLWIQSNSFDAPGPSLSLSIARIEVGRRSFVGLLCVFTVGDQEFRFANYSGAQVVLLEHDGGSIRILLSSRTHKLEVLVRRGNERFVPAREVAAEVGSLAESLDSSVRVILKQRHGSVEDIIFDASSNAAAVELAGDIRQLRG